MVLTDSLQLVVLLIDFKIPELDYPNLAKAVCDWSMDPHYSIQDDAPAATDHKPDYSLFAPPVPSPQKCMFTRLKHPPGVVSEVGPATGSTLLSVPAAEAAMPPATMSEAVVKTELKPPKASTSSNIEVVVSHPHDLSSDMPATPNTCSTTKRTIQPPPSKDLPMSAVPFPFFF
jgi:hypothetical protein